MPRPSRDWNRTLTPCARQQLVDTIDATGGIYERTCAPLADPEWVDLGVAYLQACGELGVEPYYREED